MQRDFWATTWQALRRACITDGLIKPRDRVLVMVSGGPDSTALAHWCKLLSPRIGFAWAIVYFDHALRPGSHKDGDRVERLAVKLGVRCFRDKLATRRMARQRKGGLEDAGRVLRYSHGAKLARAHGFNKVATAHTLSDQAETVILNLLRGGSLRSLAAMSACRRIVKGSRIKLIRPMLGITREQVAGFLRANKIGSLHDPMNDDPRYLRVRIRHEVLPLLRSLHPRALQHIAGISAQISLK
ncbi:MAG: tRNA lysidine(34) synthetase TilS [Elusimicrobiota bacterium]